MNRCRNILPVVAAVVALMLAVAACGHGGMAEQAARAAVDTVEAHYKAYATVEADLPLIAAADRRLDRRGVDRRTRVRAALYHGAVLDDLGRADSALLHYKRAEAACDTADHDLLGYINLRIAYIFQKEYANSTELFRKALHHFELDGDLYHQAMCWGEMANEYNASNNDSALMAINQAIRIASHGGFDDLAVSNRVSLCDYYFFNKKNYSAAKDSILSLLIDFRAGADTVYLYNMLSQCYSHLGMADSAWMAISNLPEPATPTEHLNLLLSLTEYEKTRGNYSVALELKNKSALLCDSIKSAAQRPIANSVEAQITNDSLNASVLDLRKKKAFALGLTTVVTLLLFAIVFILRKTRKTSKIRERELAGTSLNLSRSLAELEQTSCRVDRLQQELAIKTNDNEADKKYNEELLRQIEVLNESLQEYKLQSQRQAATNLDEINQKVQDNIHVMEQFILVLLKTDKRKLSEFRFHILHEEQGKAFWGALITYANEQNNGLLTALQSRYPELTVQDIHFLALYYSGFSNNSMAFLTKVDNIRSVSNKKRLLAKEKMHSRNLDEVKNNYLLGKL